MLLYKNRNIFIAVFFLCVSKLLIQTCLFLNSIMSYEWFLFFVINLV